MNTKLGGPKDAAQALRLLPEADQKRILKEVHQTDPQRAKAIQSHLIQFQDITRLLPGDLNLLLQKTDNNKLYLSLRGCNEPLKLYFKKNLSNQRFASIFSEVEAIGPQKKSSVEEAQIEICKLMLKLREAGEISLALTGSLDDYV